MRRCFPLLALLLATGCGGGEERRSSEELRTFDVEEAAPSAPASADMAASSPPQIAPTAAPGVAFNYRYAFRLPSARVASVQEEHAQACEKLGPDRCRITGMRYRLIGAEDVEAMLAFKLDPAIARRFGKAGVAAVARAEGMLVDSEISGEDVGSEIQAANRNEAELREELARIDEQLARRGLGASERAELQAQAERIRESLRANRANRTERQESLAKTPVVFQYGSGDLAPGFDTRSPLLAALDRAGENFIEGLSLMLILVITMLPWALLLMLLAWLFRRAQKVWTRAEATESAGSAHQDQG